MPKNAWKNYRKDVADRRMNKLKVSNSIKVQRLEENVSGAKQSYKRLCPYRKIKLEHSEELTLESLKAQVCGIFEIFDKEVDILETERGPSCEELDDVHLNKDELLVRFVDPAKKRPKSAFVESVKREPQPQRRQTVAQFSRRDTPQTSSIQSVSVKTVSQFSRPQFVNKKRRSSVVSDTPVPLGLITPSSIMKVGVPIKPKRETCSIFLEQFNLLKKEWNPPFEITILLDVDKFASGGFRDVYHGVILSSTSRSLQTKVVVKKMKADDEEFLSNVIQHHGSLTNHCRKIVQMNEVVMHYAGRFEVDVPVEFGRVFSYNRVYFGTLGDEPITVENFIDGKFTKYINNTGEIIGYGELVEKAECFAHYSYLKSEKTMIILDIQGMGFKLLDPEIATSSNDVYDDEGQEQDHVPPLFCAGNLSDDGISAFLLIHECSKYCKMLRLPELE